MIVIGVLSATAVAARKNAVATYMWLGEASDYAVRAANMDGIYDDPEIHTSQVRQYFDAAFSNITQTSCSGNRYTPQTGSPYPGVITLNGFEPVSPGESVPGGTASQPGYAISVDAPVLSVSLPLIGSQYIDVPMKYYAALKTH